MSSMVQTEPIQIGGAGPAGLASAITLARAGRRVLTHETQCEVGYRFDGDFQELENWSAQQDVLDQLREMVASKCMQLHDPEISGETAFPIHTLARNLP